HNWGSPMSKEIRIQYAEPLGGITFDPTGMRTFASLAAAPTASIAGYAKGCLFVNTAGSLGTLVYFNSGTTTSAIWTSIG
ncbi:MAG: hypothetical protein V4510_11445, partial [bacterium]